MSNETRKRCSTCKYAHFPEPERTHMGACTLPMAACVQRVHISNQPQDTWGILDGKWPFTTGLDCTSWMQIPIPDDAPLTAYPKTGTLCSVCDLPQYESPHGPVCENGHGGAPPKEC